MSPPLRLLCQIGPTPAGTTFPFLFTLLSVSLRVRLLSRSQREVDDQQIRRLQSGYSVCEGPSLDTQTLMRPAIKVSWRSNSPAEESKTKASRAVVVPVSFSEFFEVHSLELHLSRSSDQITLGGTKSVFWTFLLAQRAH